MSMYCVIRCGELTLEWVTTIPVFPTQSCETCLRIQVGQHSTHHTNQKLHRFIN